MAQRVDGDEHIKWPSAYRKKKKRKTNKVAQFYYICLCVNKKQIMPVVYLVSSEIH